MRRESAGLLGAALTATALVAGCAGDDSEARPAPLPTIAVQSTFSPSASPTPVPSWTDPVSPPTGAPTTPPAPTPTEEAGTSPLATYTASAAAWQRARSRFFTGVASGRPMTLAEQRKLAADYLTATRTFAHGLRTGGWPTSAGGAVRALLAVNSRQQARLAAMANAASSSAFAAELGGYGTVAGEENRAVAAVRTALGG